MKSYLKVKKGYLLISIILLIIVIVASIFFSRSSTKQDTAATPTDPMKDTKLMERNELQAFDIIDQVVEEYILETYPQATNIVSKVEFAGSGAGITNATYTTEGQKNERKIYLIYADSIWSVIYESANKISCDKVRELVSMDTVLTSYCDN